MPHRNKAIDTAKGLGIILVVLGHNILLPHGMALREMIYSFHVPLFFFLSGLLINKHRNYFEFFQNKLQGLIKPYITISVILCLIRVMQKKPTGFLESLAGLLYGTGPTVAITPLWFLPSLFVACMLALSIIKLNTKHPEKIWVGAWSLGLIGLGALTVQGFWHPTHTQDDWMGIHGLPGLPWNIDLAPLTCGFLLLGYLCKDAITQANFKAPLLLAASSIFLALHYFFNAQVDLNIRLYTHPVIASVEVFLGIYIAIGVSLLLSQSRFLATVLSHIGKGSLFILMLHITFQSKAYFLLFKLSGHHLLSGVLSLFFGVGLPLLCCKLITHHAALSALFFPMSKPDKPQPNKSCGATT